MGRPDLLLSLDYEPWFSVNDPDEAAVILPPAEAILAACEAAGARATLFVDILALARLREVGRGNVADAIAVQVRAAVARGHDAQLHLHPHWLDADWTGHAWRFPAESYRLDAPGMDDADVAARTEELARRGIALLREAVGDAQHPVRAFRAGGYAIQPCDGAVLRGLAAAGILIDSSVVPGMRKRTGRQAVDFSAAPRRATWRIGPEGGVLAPAESGLLEVPVAAIDLGPRAGLAQLHYFRSAKGALIGGGGHSRDAAGEGAGQGGRASRLLRAADYGMRGWTPLIFPLPAALLLAAAQAWMARFAGEPGIAFSALLHPKGFTTGMLEELRAFLGAIGPEVAFPTFGQLAAKVFPQDGGPC